MHLRSEKKDSTWNKAKDKVEAWLKTQPDLEFDAFKKNKGKFFIRMRKPEGGPMK